MMLTDLPVLLFDVQATAAASAGGRLLEVGWQRYPSPTGKNGHEAHTVVARQDASGITPRLLRLTGLSPDDLRTGCPPGQLGRRLLSAAHAVAADGVCPIVVHYARFERPFFERLWADGLAAAAEADRRAAASRAGERTVDCQIRSATICTHEIARRLLPGLPRKGLRAVAGYFGHDTPPERRCSHHLQATAVIWAGLATRLSEAHGIATVGDLATWIDETPVPPKGSRVFQVPQQVVDRLPHGPGVYRLLSHAGKPLYVGKAKDLGQRVRTYFQPRRRHAEHILEMLSRAAKLKITPTRTALEAALLEQDCIKRLAPPYNLALHPNGAGLGFWSRRFAGPVNGWDRRHRLGPLPDSHTIALLAPLTACLAAEDALQDLTAALGVQHLTGPQAVCVAEGLRQFRHEHADTLDRLGPERALPAIGRQLWQARHLVPPPDPAEVDAAADEEEAAADEAAWTPERVHRHLEHAVCHAAALLRRSRWLTALGNAALGWDTLAEEEPPWRRLVLRGGRVVARRSCVSSARVLPCILPAAPRRWHPQDRITYDRLRVATTELRRLVQERRPIVVQLPPLSHETGARRRLTGADLARLLRWI